MASDTLRFLDTDLDGYTETLVLNKRVSTMRYVQYMLDRTSQMFTYEGLPETIPGYMIELILQSRGYACFAEVETLFPQDRLGGLKRGLFVLRGSFGEKPDIYLRPTGFIVANPALAKSYNFTIGKDCEIIKNDTRGMGLLPMFFRYAQQMTENDISIRSAQINSRQHSTISAKTDAERESALEYLQQVEAGEVGVVAEDRMASGIKVHAAGSSAPNSIIQLIELQQYLKASWFNEIGLNTNFNMKREYLSAEEIAANTDVLLPLVDDMFYCRQEAIDRVNAMFGTKIKVSKNSSWDNKARESESEIVLMENKAEAEDGDDNAEKKLSEKDTD